MLNPDETLQLRRIPLLTPPGRPLEVGWAQEFARWLWHVFVLPADLAKPWPRWMHRFMKPLLLRLAREVGVSNVRSIRSWALHLTLIDPPRGDWSSPEGYLQARRRHVTSLGALVHHAVAPRIAPLLYGIAARVESYSAALSLLYARANRGTRLAAGAVALALFALAASTPLSMGQQCVLMGSMWLLTLLVRQLPGYGPGIIMIVFSIIASSRYIWWRLTQTMDLNTGFEEFFAAGLLAAECYTWIIMVLGYVQNARPLRRKSAPLPADRALWPTVDIFVPSYNESLEVVKPTVLAALNLDWPADKLKVYILDDGRRPQFREFAARCGAEYMIRSNNAHAKAGNLNHALTITRGEFVAIFDCDHIPMRTFLTTTMGWFLRDPKCAMLQTPHHFFSPDPFETKSGHLPPRAQRGQSVLRFDSGRQRSVERDLLLRLVCGAQAPAAGGNRRHRRGNRHGRRAHGAQTTPARLHHRVSAPGAGRWSGNRKPFGTYRPAHSLGARHGADISASTTRSPGAD